MIILCILCSSVQNLLEFGTHAVPRTEKAWNKAGNVRIKVNAKKRSCDHCCRDISVSITYSECVFLALFTQHSKRMHRIILPSVACPALPYFQLISYSRQHNIYYY